MVRPYSYLYVLSSNIIQIIIKKAYRDSPIRPCCWTWRGQYEKHVLSLTSCFNWVVVRLKNTINRFVFCFFQSLIVWCPIGKRGVSATRNAVAAWWREKDKCWKRRWTAVNIALRWCRNGRAWAPGVRTIPEARLKVHWFCFSVRVKYAISLRRFIDECFFTPVFPLF